MSLKRSIYRLLKYDSLKRTLGFSVYNPIKVINGRKIIFIHIPKNGGTSIGPMIGFEKREHFELNNDGERTKKNIENSKKTLQHRDASEILDIVGNKNWNRSYKFSFVRNPWSRMYSWYRYKVMINHHQMKTQPIEFNDWVKAVCRNQEKPYYHSEKLYQSQFKWLSVDGKSIGIDFIGKFEEFQKDYKEVAQLIGINPKIPHYNRGDGQASYRKAYTLDSKNLVGDFYQEDVNYWGYEF